LTGAGKSPSWNGARMAANWLSGTPPRKTRVSVPRLTPEKRVRTSTSSGPGRGTTTGRISPSPGARIQKAYAGGSTSASQVLAGSVSVPGRAWLESNG
jgi:hypothetical protein